MEANNDLAIQQELTIEKQKHFNGLTPAEDERLSLLAEECAEVIQAIMKIQRHGYESYHPVTLENNRAGLERELGHLELALWMMSVSITKDVDSFNIDEVKQKKFGQLKQYTHHQEQFFGEDNE